MPTANNSNILSHSQAGLCLALLKHWLLVIEWIHWSSPVLVYLFNSISFDQLILYWKTNVLPKKILSDYSGDKWRPAVACESNKFNRLIKPVREKPFGLFDS